MENYKVNRKLITINCDQCSNEFDKPVSEYNRNIAKDRKNYCSRSCSAKANNKGVVRNPIPPSNSDNRKDNFTKFRYYLRNSLKRFKDNDLTLEYLKQLYEVQDGKCPYSGVELILSTYTKIVKDPIYSASLDRIDSDKGYVQGNVQFVSMAVNYMKNCMSHEETITMCKIIANNYKHL